jgi:hypothetical protein
MALSHTGYHRRNLVQEKPGINANFLPIRAHPTETWNFATQVAATFEPPARDIGAASKGVVCSVHQTSYAKDSPRILGIQFHPSMANLSSGASQSQRREDVRVPAVAYNAAAQET